jgi:methylmalonyl-CoA/ethylmalonyl-CoA epimerase
VTIALSALGQIALPVSDADRADAFDSEKLGLPRLFRFGDLAFFDCGGVRLMLEATARRPAKPKACASIAASRQSTAPTRS